MKVQKIFREWVKWVMGKNIGENVLIQTMVTWVRVHVRIHWLCTGICAFCCVCHNTRNFLNFFKLQQWNITPKKKKTLWNNQWMKEEIMREMRRYLQRKHNISKLMRCSKREEISSYKCSHRKTRMISSQQPNFTTYENRKRTTKPTASRRKEI